MRSVMAISWVLGACLLAATALAEPGEEADADLGADADADADDSAVEVTEDGETLYPLCIPPDNAGKCEGLGHYSACKGARCCKGDSAADAACAACDIEGRCSKCEPTHYPPTKETSFKCTPMPKSKQFKADPVATTMRELHALWLLLQRTVRELVLLASSRLAGEDLESAWQYRLDVPFTRNEEMLVGGVALATAVLARALTSQGQGGGAAQFVGEVLINVVIATVCYTTAGTFSWHWEVVATPTQWRLFNPATTLAAEMVGWSVVIALPIEFLGAVLGAPTLYAYAPAVPIIAIAARYTDVVHQWEQHYDAPEHALYFVALYAGLQMIIAVVMWSL